MAGEPERTCRQCGDNLHWFGDQLRCGTCGLPADVTPYEALAETAPPAARTAGVAEAQPVAGLENWNDAREVVGAAAAETPAAKEATYAPVGRRKGK